MNARLPHIATDTAQATPLLSELRQAVAAELSAAQTQAALFRVEVYAGKLGAETDDGYMYTFLLSALLPVLDDMPGELHIGRRIHPCRIVSVAGLRVTVLLTTAPARFIERATLAAQPWAALARLDEALARRAAAGAAGAGLSAALFSGESAPVERIAPAAAGPADPPLAEAHREALAAALERSVTVITGPAHTGKTHLLRRVAASCVQAGCRVLLLAPSHDAIDAALRPLAAAGASDAYVAGKLLRLGCSPDPSLRRAYPLLAPERAARLVEAERERERAALDAERAALAEREQTLGVLQKAAALAQQAAVERDAAQAAVDALAAQADAASGSSAEPTAGQRLRERWLWLRRWIMRFGGRATRRAERAYRESAERQRQESYGHAQRLAEAQRRLEEKAAAAARLEAGVRQQLAQYDLNLNDLEGERQQAVARSEALAVERERAAAKPSIQAAYNRALLVGGTLSHALAGEAVPPQSSDTQSRSSDAQSRLSYLQPQSFDVVLIDDAHRVPLPHLFWAAGLARSRVVVATEPAALQLWHCAQQAVAHRWLGRSFIAYLGGRRELGAPAALALAERYGIAPALAASVTGWLAETDSASGKRLPTLDSGFRRNDELQRSGERRRSPVRGRRHRPLTAVLEAESPVALVDTGALKPWCAAIPRHGRVNVGSALTTVALAERLRAADAAQSIALVTPYHAQARLLLHLARDRQLADAIGVYAPPCLPSRAADVVILDTVEAPGRFSWSALDDSRPDSPAYDLFSSVCAQARQRLLLVAHDKHVRAAFGARSLLRRMLSDAADAGWAASAGDCVASYPAGALSRAPQAPGANAARNARPTAADGWGLLLQDLETAQRGVTIWSPHLALNTVERVLGRLPSALLERGAVRVVTLPPDALRGGRRAQAAAARRVCEQVGVVVAEQSTLAANLVTVDDRLAWECTLPPLSAGSGGLQLRRIESAPVARLLRTLLAAEDTDTIAPDAAFFMPFAELGNLAPRADSRSF